MAGNSFGQAFRFTTWGESHGPAIGCVIDGCPPGVQLSEADIQPYLDKRRPGQSRFVTQRQEPDQAGILSGVFEGLTTGTPISIEIQNADQRSKDYSEIAAQYRPGHADFSYDAKYGHRDYRGGGRSSARETAMRVAAGAVARKALTSILGKSAIIRGAVAQIGPDYVDRVPVGLGSSRIRTRFSARKPQRLSAGKAWLTRPARMDHRSGRLLRSWRKGFRPALASRSIPSSTAISRAA